MRKILVIVIFAIQSCTNVSIKIPEIDKAKNIESFHNKIISKQDNKKIKNSQNINKKEKIENNKTIEAYWWEKIKSKALQQKIQILLKQNLDLKTAMSRIEQASVTSNIAENKNYPKTDLNLNSARSKSSNNLYSSNSGYELSSYWGFEIFNHYIKKAKANLKTTQEEENSLKQLLVANLTKLYIKISYHQKLLNLKQKLLEISKEILSISTKRYEHGLQGIGAKEIISLQQKINQNRNLLEKTAKNIKEYSYQIDLILGQKIGTNNYEEKYLLPKDFVAVNPKPNGVINNRPDIKALKNQIEAAGEDISIAISDLYPDLSFGINSKTSEESFKDFFDLSKLASSIFAQISFKMLNKGDIKNNIKIQKSKYKEVSYQYAQKILQSFLEIEKSIMLGNFYIKQEQREKEALFLSKKNERIYQRGYSSGTSSAIEYLQAQKQTIMLQQELLKTQQLKWINHISLNLAVGK